MANTIAYATGIDKNGREKVTSRLGSKASEGRVATWHTVAVAYIEADGSGYVQVTDKDSGRVLHRADFPSEHERRTTTQNLSAAEILARVYGFPV